jgi:F-type H+-transporting ATPase subunit b
MINLSILISSSEVSGPGGLFDINATLPLVAIQFVLLTIILNIILYNPLLTIIEERKEYILTNLSKASEILAEANKLTEQYEQELTNVRKEAQLEITNSQKIHKEILETELKVSQKYIDNLLDTITKDLLNKKDIALNSFNIEKFTIDTTTAGQVVNLTTRNTNIVDLIVNGGEEGNIVTINADIPDSTLNIT